MQVQVDEHSGFCFGVKHAIEAAENELDKGNIVYCLGEIVHNQVQMDNLVSKGLKVVSLEAMPSLKGKTVLFRAHGEPPETFRIAAENKIKVIDATCPIVAKLQQSINQINISRSGSDVQIVIFGRKNHAEVAGLTGNAGNNAIIVSDENELKEIDFSKPIHLFSQTTMDSEKYQSIANTIQKKMTEAHNTDLVIHKSVCGQVSGRALFLREFAAKNDILIFVSGQNSANGNYLFGICKSINEKSFFISNIQEINNNWFDGIQTVGISGATSTPQWLIDQVADYIESLNITS